MPTVQSRVNLLGDEMGGLPHHGGGPSTVIKMNGGGPPLGGGGRGGAAGQAQGGGPLLLSGDPRARTRTGTIPRNQSLSSFVADTFAEVNSVGF